MLQSKSQPRECNKMVKKRHVDLSRRCRKVVKHPILIEILSQGEMAIVLYGPLGASGLVKNNFLIWEYAPSIFETFNALLCYIINATSILKSRFLIKTFSAL